MPLVLTELGSSIVLDTITENLPLMCFPYQNDRTPKKGDLISAYVECTFSGYGGAIPLLDWTPAEVQQGRAISQPTPTGWTHNGGPIDNFIFGICIVDNANNLIFAERDPRAPYLITPTNPAFSYQLRLSDLAEWPG
jgi:hypothetical protein